MQRDSAFVPAATLGWLLLFSAMARFVRATPAGEPREAESAQALAADSPKVARSHSSTDIPARWAASRAA